MNAASEMLEFPELGRIQRRTHRRSAYGAIVAEVPVRLNRDHGRLHPPLLASVQLRPPAEPATQRHFTALRQSQLTQIKFGLASCLILLPEFDGISSMLQGALRHGLIGLLLITPALAAPTLPGWTWRAEALSSWRPHFQNSAARLQGQFEPAGGGPAIGLYVGYYRDQRYGRQLVTSVNRLVDDETDKEWSVTAAGQTVLDTSAGHLAWQTADLRGQALSQVSGDGSRAPRLHVWQVYWINGRFMASDWQAKLYGAWCSLLGRGDDAAVVLVYTDKASAGADDARLRDFLRTHVTSLDTALRGVRDQHVTGHQ